MRLPAGNLEGLVIDRLRAFLDNPTALLVSVRQAALRTANENEMGELQSPDWFNPTEHRSRQKTKECLEYILVHEMAHWLEPTHNARFIGLMDQYMPKWQSHREATEQIASSAREL